MKNNMRCKECKKVIKPTNYVGKTVCKSCDEKHLQGAKKAVREFYRKFAIDRKIYPGVKVAMPEMW